MKIRVTGKFCYDEFLSLIISSHIPVDCQPVILDDELMESNHTECKYLKRILLMYSKENQNVER